MNCKKFFITTTLVSLMSFLPGISFSDAVQNDNVGGNFYISGKYVPSVSHFGVFSAKQERNTTTGVFGLKQDWDGSTISKNSPENTFNVPNYSFKYENNPFLGFAGAVGYLMNGPRIELEMSYETFDVKNQGNNYKNDAHKYYALTHNSGGKLSNAGDKFVFLKNEGLLDISLMLNACYDVISEGIPFSPYICAGVGTDLISMFEAINPKISYQGKLGLSYSISPEASVFVGGHFHKVIGNEFRDIPAMIPSTSTLTGNHFTIVTLSVCHFGVELGGRFNF
ncbi:major outer membrane protein OMP-1F [Ehrlichia chaffeensis str. Arkansas]|uniref:Major outer membrane protein OMP-1F n=2 Tax=Ehrlichia chaffeensis TaxID=945 RepID=Q2GF57_EHRCR|nr:P44/Msp2 family outer membrane protein [Ehrlichia chaffeensis]AAC02940.1 major outer membrane protein OMP-1F [Ehrlichia chaffeensis]AAO12931.1 28kDa outer membrane protein gene 18 [Ehrlichia chaffeensis]AAO12937.1 28kDa outer membrane protein gene 18 [Ehrlichia chaffeensis]ABD45057.1 major outer membrane protein OMP-1F [Ehrlichia chaffeensis str. Arkansas]AHX07415.1 surface antigen family protein [Ehrlichia chaffeensis str. Osceola]